MKKRQTIILLGAVAIVALATLLAVVSARPASAYPNKQKDCTSCHGDGTLQGTVTATPSTATPAANAAYTVDITIAENPNGSFGTGYWIATSTAAGGTGASTGVYGGGPGSTTQNYTATMTAPATPGTYYYKVFGVDGTTNTQAKVNVATFSVTVADAPPPADTTAPTTAATGATAGAWYNHPVVVTLTATDNAGGSGIASIVWALDGAAPQTVTAATTPVTIDAPAGGAADGPHTLAYHAVDVATNTEAGNSLTVNIDTVKPTTLAPAAASVKRLAKAKLRYQVNDVAPNAGTANVTIKIKNAGGKVVKTLKLGAKPVNVAGTASFTCKLAKGKYKYLVYATDAAGNTQVKAASNKLTVK